MKNKLALTVLTITLLVGLGAATVSAQSLLNEMKIGSCIKPKGADAQKFKADKESTKTPEEQLFDYLVSLERRRGLVLDARPFAINQATGKLSFSGNEGRVTVVNMNPFAYSYTVSVAQHELVSSALTDFIDLLLPAKLRPGRPQSGGTANLTDKNAQNNQDTRIGQILDRLNDLHCNNTEEGCKALTTLKELAFKVQEKLKVLKHVKEPDEFGQYRNNLGAARNEEVDAYGACVAATTLRSDLRTFFSNQNALTPLNNANDELKIVERLATDLRSLLDQYNRDTGLNTYNARCRGFKCIDQVVAYSSEAATILDSFRREVDEQLQTAEEMTNTLKATDAMASKEGLFARTSTIIKRFEFTEAEISLTRGPVNKKNQNVASAASAPTGAAAAATGGGPNPVVKGGGAPSGSGGPNNNDGDAVKAEEKLNDDKDATKDKAAAPAGNGGNTGGGGNALTNASTQSIQIGRARFLLSGGLVFSPMQRQTFDKITGFAHDANGNPTGTGNDNVVGVTEDSPRRLLPMAILNTRIHSWEPTSFYFSLGVTAKHDDNVDIEYLLGPSVSLLNERALFTFGGYVGKVQTLVPDVQVGDKIPASAGDAKLFTKHYSWKPGFSFSYVFSESKKQSESLAGGGGGQGSSSNKADLKDEIRIGGVPFSLAMGLIYTSLEDQTYDEILGFARDRMGNLTNGKNLTRIAGLASDSDYRMVPMAMLHTRLLKFGSRSLYFTTGVSGRKVDDKVKIEYLLGPSVNLYRRKLFFTFGAFAGKRQTLSGDFFPGAALEKDQSVTTHDRYIWKPAFGFSYDISRIFRRDAQ
jgi:hypothetical protein